MTSQPRPTDTLPLCEDVEYGAIAAAQMRAPILPAVTVWQPWASLIALRCKPYEFRSRPAPRKLWGRRIAIHAGARPVRKAEVSDLILRLRDDDQAWTTCLARAPALAILERVHAAPGILPLAHVVCTAVLGQPVEGWRIVAEIGRELNDSDRRQHCNWGWPLSDIAPLEPPVPAKGAQGFWPWPMERAA